MAVAMGTRGVFRLTEHVTLAVLATTLVRNVGLDAEIDQGQVLHVIRGRVDASDNTEALAMMDLLAELVEFPTKSGQGEVVPVDGLAIELKSYSSWSA